VKVRGASHNHPLYGRAVDDATDDRRTDPGLWLELHSRFRFTSAALIVLLMPNVRQDQPFWQRYVEPFRDRTGSMLRTEFLPGRPRFYPADGSRPGRPPFGLVLLVWQSYAPALPTARAAEGVA
jgi:hypothetical protein